MHKMGKELVLIMIGKKKKDQNMNHHYSSTIRGIVLLSFAHLGSVLPHIQSLSKLQDFSFLFFFGSKVHLYSLIGSIGRYYSRSLNSSSSFASFPLLSSIKVIIINNTYNCPSLVSTSSSKMASSTLTSLLPGPASDELLVDPLLLILLDLRSRWCRDSGKALDELTEDPRGAGARILMGIVT